VSDKATTTDATGKLTEKDVGERKKVKFEIHGEELI
jgi:hypothetical protein